MQITKATIEDAKELLKIYEPYVTNTAVSFEYIVPSVKEFTDRIINISKELPYIKAVEDCQIVGYAYASKFKQRAAYDWSVETTIYISEDKRRLGIGKELYLKLEDILSNMGILNMNACIAVPKGDDIHLSSDSVYFHEKMGFKKNAIFHDSGYKFNTWYDMIWMEKIIGEHLNNQPNVEFGQWIKYL